MPKCNFQPKIRRCARFNVIYRISMTELRHFQYITTELSVEMILAFLASEKHTRARTGQTRMAIKMENTRDVSPTEQFRRFFSLSTFPHS